MRLSGCALPRVRESGKRSSYRGVRSRLPRSRVTPARAREAHGLMLCRPPWFVVQPWGREGEREGPPGPAGVYVGRMLRAASAKIRGFLSTLVQFLGLQTEKANATLFSQTVPSNPDFLDILHWIQWILPSCEKSNFGFRSKGEMPSLFCLPF